MMLVLTGPCLGKEQKTVGYLPVSDAIEEIFLGAGMRSGHKAEAAQRGIQGASRDGGILGAENRGGAVGGVDLVFRFVCDSLLEGFEPSVPAR
jgi:hypothetical protein